MNNLESSEHIEPKPSNFDQFFQNILLQGTREDIEHALLYFPAYLKEIENYNELEIMLKNYLFLKEKINKTNINTLIQDFSTDSDNKTLPLLKQALQISSYILEKSKDQLPNQLVSRLLQVDNTKMNTLLKEIELHEKFPWIKPLMPSRLKAKGSVVAIIEDISGKPLQSSDNKMYFIGTQSGQIRIFNTQTGLLDTSFNGHTSAIKIMLESRSGNELYSGSKDGEICIWNIESRNLILKIPAHDNPIETILESKSNKYIITTSFGDSLIKVWDINTGLEHLELSTNLGRGLEVVKSSSDPYIIAIYPASYYKEKGRITCWNLEDGKVIHDVENPFEMTWATGLSIKGLFKSDYSDAEIQQWILSSKQFIVELIDQDTPLWQLTSHIKYLEYTAFARTEKTLTFNVWDGQTADKVFTFKHKLSISESEIFHLRTLGKDVFIKKAAGVYLIKILDTYKLVIDKNNESLYNKYKKEYDISILQESDDRNHLIIAGEKSLLLDMFNQHIEDKAINSDMQVIHKPPDYTIKKTQTRIEIHTKQAAIKKSSDVISPLKESDLQRIKKNLKGRDTTKKDFQHRDLEGIIDNLDFNNQGEFIRDSGRYGLYWDIAYLNVFDTQLNNEVVAKFEFTHISTAIVTKDDRYAVVFDHRGLFILDLTEPYEEYELDNGDWWPDYIIENSEGTQLILNGLTVINVEQKTVSTIETHTDTITPLKLSKNGQEVISGSQDGTVKIFDIQTSSLLYEFRYDYIDLGAVISTHMSLNEKYIIAAFENGHICIWEKDTQQLLCINTLDNPLEDMVFDIQTNTISALTTDNQLQLFQVQNIDLGTMHEA